MNQDTPDIDLPLVELLCKVGVNSSLKDNEHWRAVLDARLVRDVNTSLGNLIASLEEGSEKTSVLVQKILEENRRLTRWTFVMALATTVLALATVIVAFKTH